MVVKIITSKKFTLDGRDYLKGFLIACLTPVFVVLQKIADSYIKPSAVHLSFEWEELLMAAIGGGAGYLLQKFISPSKTILKEVKPKIKNNGNKETNITS